MTRTADVHTRDCEAVTKTGGSCRAKALRDSDPPRCRLHAMTPEQRSADAKRAAHNSAFARRSKAEPKASSGLGPTVTLLDVIEACVPALSATFSHDQSPDWSARLAAAGTLLVSFPRQLRDTPERVRALIEQCLPSQVLDQAGIRERLKAQNVYTAMRQEWDRLRVKNDPTTGLYIEPYPPHLIAPWEDRKVVLASQPNPTGRIEHALDGAVILYRDGEDMPLLVPQQPRSAYGE